MSYCDHLPSVVRLSTPLKDFSSETPGTVFFKLHVEPSVKGELKISTNGHAFFQDGRHAHIWLKHLKIFSRTKKASRLSLSIQHHGLKVYQVCSNDDHGLIYLRQGQIGIPMHLYGEKC